MAKGKRYEKGRMTVLGNKKLSRTIGIFNLPPVKTCPNHSDCFRTCYAMKAFVRYPTVRAKWSYNLAQSKTSSRFIAKMIKEILDTKIKHYRLHGSGDFYSDDYFFSWVVVAKALPAVQFHTFTKVAKYMVLVEQMKKAGTWPSNFNIIFSFIDGHLNYGDKEYVKHLEKEHGATLCPATVKGQKVVCGEDCSYCMTQDKPVFIKH